MPLFNDNDCRNVGGKNRFNLEGIVSKEFKSSSTMLLIGLQLYCIERRIQEGDEIFPREKREELNKEIKKNVKQMTKTLLAKSAEEFKFLGLALLDYESTLNSKGDNSNFNKSLAEAILYYYRTLASKEEGLKNLDSKYEGDMQYEKIKNIKLEDKLHSYFERRKNSNSLHRISRGIKLILESIHDTNIKITSVEKRLVVQEALRLAGEYLKSTPQTPNLEKELVKQLEEKGVPVVTLTKFRDMLTHKHLFPLMDNESVDEAISEGLPAVKDIIDSEIVKLESEFIRGIINRNFNKIQNENFREMVSRNNELDITDEGKYIPNLLKALKLIKKEDIYRSLKDEDKLLIDEIYENAQQMNSKLFTSDDIERVSKIDFSEKEKSISASLEENINPSQKLEKLREGLRNDVIKKVKGLESIEDDRFKNLYKEIIDGRATESSVLTYLKKLRIEEDVSQNTIKHLRDFYSEKITVEFNLLKELKNIYAIRSQILNLYDIVERNDNFVGVGRRARIEKLKATRNYLSHGGALVSVNEDLDLAGKVAELLREGVITKLENIPITLREVETAIESVRSNNNLKEIIGEVEALICGNVPQRNRRHARSADESCLTWEEIDKFNEGGIENRDPDNVIIDSEKFLSSISNELEVNDEKFSNFIALASESEVIGDYKHKVNMVTDNYRYLGHLERVGKVSGMVMHGMIAKNVVGDLLSGDYVDVAVNVGFLAGSLGLGKLAQVASMKGAGYLLEGRVLLGKSLRFASPFLSRGVSAFIAYDLFNQVKEYGKGNKDALVPIVGDSVQLGVDSIELGVEVGEMLGLELLEGVSAVTGPIGMAIGAIVFIGTEIYTTVRTVEKIDKRIHLTGWEKVAEGTRAFFGQQPSDYIEKLIEEKEANNQAVKSKLKFFEDNLYVQRYVFPSIRVVQGSDSKHIYQVISDNVVLLDQKRNDIKWSRTRPDFLEGIDLFCLPKGDWESVPKRGTYYCDGGIGIEYANNRAGNYTLISLGDGRDRVKGFQDSSNIFVLGNGHKEMTGGNKDDNFIFGENATYGSEIKGYINGLGGIDTIDVTGLTPHYDGSKGVDKYQVFADFRQGILRDTSNVALSISNINKFLGRKGRADHIVPACDTKYMDGKGGENKQYLDSITIPRDDTCFYDTKIIVNPYTKVTNDAINGNFTFFIRGGKGEEAYIYLDPNSHCNNMFAFNYTLIDIAAINKCEKNINFRFVEEFYRRENKLDVIKETSFNLDVSGAYNYITTFHLIDNTKIVLGQNNVYAMQNTEKPIDSLVQDYSSIADKLEMYVIVHSNDEILTVGHSRHDVLMNDPKARVSHLVGNGGENVFVITSGHEKLTLAHLPISDVIIYDFDHENKVDSLSLRELKEQVKKDIGREVRIEFIEVDSDLLLNLSLDDASKIEVVKIRLKGALENNWYKRVNVVIDSVFMIEEILGDFKLTPQPLIFDDNSKTIYVINPNDVVEGDTIIVKKEIGDYTFARHNNALIITNSLSSNVDKNNLSTIVLNDFYYNNNQDKMQTLKIEFNDEKILLRKEIERINVAGNFIELKRKVRIDSYKAVMRSIKEQQLFAAIEGNNIGKIKELISHGVRIDATNNDGQTPLQYAAQSGNLEVVRYLILIEEKSANFILEGKSGQTLLHFAIKSDNLEVVKYVIEEKKVDFNVSDGFGLTPLHFAAERGDLEIVKYLIEEKGVGFNERDSLGHTPSEYAALRGNLEILRYLIEEKDVYLNLVVTSRQTLLHYAADGGNLEIVKYLIEEKKVAFNVKDGVGQTILHFAADGGNLEIVKYLTEEKEVGSNVQNDFGLTPLHYAALSGNLEVVRYLIEEKEANFKLEDKFGHTVLHYAAKSGNLEVVRYLIEKKGADVNVNGKYGETLIHFAAGGSCKISYRSGNTALEIVKYLIEKKEVDFKVKNDFGQTPVHYAAKCGNLEVVKYLIEKCVAVNVADSSGRISLPYATCNGNLRTVQELTEVKRACASVKDTSGRIPLHFATMGGYFEIARYLIEVGGADINTQCNSGLTPLHYCAGSKKLVEYLIEKGAKIDLKVDGQTPLEVLVSKGYKDVVDSINKKLTEIIFDAIKYDDFGEIQGLINQGVSVNVKDGNGQTLLHYAVSNGKLKVGKYLMGKGAKINLKVNDQTPLEVLRSKGYERELDSIIEKLTEKLFNAVRYNNFGEVQRLIDQGVSVNVKNCDGQTPLHYAARNGELEIVKYLIDKKAHINVKDKDGKKPQDIATQLSVVKFLEQVQLELDKKLLIAAKGDDLSEVEDLVTQGANIRAQDENDQIPLCIAVQYNRLDIINFLLCKGTNIEESDFHANTMLRLAYCIKGVMEKINNEVETSDFEELKRKLPESVRNMVYSSEVCIKNVAYNRYLWSPDKSGNYQFDNERRYVFLMPLHEEDKNAFKWKVEPNGDNVYLMNVGEKRYLYSPNSNFQFDDERRYVFTWPSHEKENNAFKWKVEPNGDNVYLKNVGEKRYLYSPNNHYNFQFFVDQRYVFTWLSNEGDDDVKWKVEDCEVSRRSRRHYISPELHHRGRHNDSVHFKSIGARKHRSVAKVVEASLQNDKVGYNKGKATSGGSKPSFWINDLVGWVINSIGKLSSKPEETSSTASSMSQIDMQIDADGTIILLDLLIRKVTGQKYISVADQHVSLIEAQGYALNITEGFEKVLNEAAIKSGISAINFNFNPVKTQSAIVRHIRNGKFHEISESLYSFAKEMCPELEQKDKFLAYLKSCLEEVLVETEYLLPQQKVDQTSNQPISKKVGANELSKTSDTLLNGVSVVKGISNVLE